MDEDKCSLCGSPAFSSDEFCTACGAALGHHKQSSGPSREDAATREPSAKVERPVAPVRCQGVAVRFVAQLVDVIILGVVFWILSFTGAGTITVDASTAQVSISPFLGYVSWSTSLLLSCTLRYSKDATGKPSARWF